MIGVVAALAQIGREWKLALIAIFATGFFVTLSQRNEARAQRDASREALKIEKADRRADGERADRQRTERERGFAQQQASGFATFADKLAAREPTIVHSTDTVREYAQTDAGRARCLGADRVRGLDAYLATLAGAHPVSASGRAEAVRANVDPAPAGR